MSNDSGLIQQYKKIKAQYPDAILLFRLGDFYETFEQDAITASEKLGLYLTKRGFNKNDSLPMAGIPFHALEPHLKKLVDLGYKVAICEQMTEPKPGSLVQREVIRVVTPGTLVEPHLLEPRRNNFIVAMWLEEKSAGLAYTDISTGEFRATEFNEQNKAELLNAVRQEIVRINPAELVAPRRNEQRRIRPEMLFQTEADEDDPLLPYRTLANACEKAMLTQFENFRWQEDNARHALLEHFEVASLEGFGCAKMPLVIRASGALVAYLKETQKSIAARLNSLVTYSLKQFMALDPQTRRNLELEESSRTGLKKNSLTTVLDRTHTDMGARLLRRWIGQPLLEVPRIQARLDAVEALFRNATLRDALIDHLKNIRDIERTTQRISQGVAVPKELLSFKASLERVEPLAELLKNAQPEVQSALSSIIKRLDPCTDVTGRITEAVIDDPDLLAQFAGRGAVNKAKYVIREGYSEEMDSIKIGVREAKEWVAKLEERERTRTGIPNLKVSYNQVFGYYIEISKSYLAQVPPDYIRKQTIANGERFFTSELKEKESLIVTAQDKIDALETRLYKELLEFTGTFAPRLLETASAVAHIDAFVGLAEVAERNNFVRPQINNGSLIKIVAGRHPVVEAANPDSVFVPNDVTLNTEHEQVIIITGPNMAGKSTFMRQVALIVLLGQIGSFVPADSAIIGLVDRIFTRVGAQDDISGGQSTFMVEMTETSYIMSHSTPRSLILLDEVGRGTSTYDGLAIAHAVVEYIHNNPKCGAKTLFATHYHELIELAAVLPRVVNYNVAVTEEGGKVLFLRKLIPGGADRSYGIHVAQLAGLPRSVIHRAEELLAQLEGIEKNESRRGRSRKAARPLNGYDESAQMSLFSDSIRQAETEHPLLAELRELNIMELSPIEAINKLYELQQKSLKTE
ncbi:DNA mismatch repair protein MutS [Candidatus Chlorohelix sp.]|uniref:DNA mismatch repair protein MutS n=1 Tax=Candidatus Chlorohelix sp. TaxID=3139201 RepID=UPI0030569F31